MPLRRLRHATAAAALTLVGALVGPPADAAPPRPGQGVLVECLQDATLDPVAYDRYDAQHHYVVTGSARRCPTDRPATSTSQRPGFWLVSYRHREASGLAYTGNFREFAPVAPPPVGSPPMPIGPQPPRPFGVPAVAGDVGEHGVCFVTALVGGRIGEPWPVGNPIPVSRHACFLVTVNAEVPGSLPTGVAAPKRATVVPLPLDAPLVDKPDVRVVAGPLKPGNDHGFCASCY